MEYVYVLEFPDCVKIGYSTRIDSRIKQVEAMVGHKATNIYYTEATRDTENAMRSFFEERRVKGKFFSAPFDEAKQTLLDVIHNPERYQRKKVPKPQKYTENKKASNRKWDAANLDRMSIAAPKGQKEAIQAAAAAAGMSTNAYILEAIREKMSRAVTESESVSNAAEASTEAAHTSTESPTERDSAPGVDVPGTPGNAAESG